MGALRSQEKGGGGFPACAWKALPQLKRLLGKQLFLEVSASPGCFLLSPQVAPFSHLSVSTACPMATGVCSCLLPLWTVGSLRGEMVS